MKKTVNRLSNLEHLEKAINRAMNEYVALNFAPSEIKSFADVNTLYFGDNKELLNILRSRKNPDKISLIYIDPPFYTKSDKEAVLTDGEEKKREVAYRDRWADMGEYLTMLGLRLMLMRDVLADDGLIFVHVDWHAAHYVRIMMDDIFGAERFVNEIIWQYKSGGSTKKHFARKHDNILVYSKTAKYNFYPQKEKSYNRGLKPYRFKGVEEFEDEVGWYTMVNMKDVWSIDMVGRTSGERTGYATQKPEKLMERIILSASKEGDLVADFFCGSGTFGVAAAKLGRSFIMSDIGELAINLTQERLEKKRIGFTKITSFAKND